MCLLLGVQDKQVQQPTEGFLANRKHKQFPYELYWEEAAAPGRPWLLCGHVLPLPTRLLPVVGFTGYTHRASLAFCAPAADGASGIVTCGLTAQSPHLTRLRGAPFLPFSFIHVARCRREILTGVWFFPLTSLPEERGRPPGLRSSLCRGSVENSSHPVPLYL